ncbi:hypothetical protein COM60_07135 [Bacillus toyonensis]|uniref:hypothetical protein n=1 Tax=Bacillus toyonensis TaxID=155322 RepID=UPI000BF658CD|nr:hypothetical protein [Bacillus toyonensis]PGE40388.1 hypothetical protein COM60_07135 [Bacillus toyonensis]
MTKDKFVKLEKPIYIPELPANVRVTTKLPDEFQDGRLDRVALKMGENGWTIPFSFEVSNIEAIHEEEDFDKFFISFYSENENQRFNDLVSKLLLMDAVKPYTDAIEQCIKAHKDSNYIITINTLIPILEGLLSNFYDNKNNTKMIRVCKEMLEKYTSESQWIEKLIWTSVWCFITNLYQKSDFSEESPNMLNRHWILHGRTSFSNSEADSLRLFNALSTVAALDNLNNKNDENLNAGKFLELIADKTQRKLMEQVILDVLQINK